MQNFRSDQTVCKVISHATAGLNCLIIFNVDWLILREQSKRRILSRDHPSGQVMQIRVYRIVSLFLLEGNLTTEDYSRRCRLANGIRNRHRRGAKPIRIAMLSRCVTGCSHIVTYTSLGDVYLTGGVTKLTTNESRFVRETSRLSR